MDLNHPSNKMIETDLNNNSIREIRKKERTIDDSKSNNNLNDNKSIDSNLLDHNDESFDHLLIQTTKTNSIIDNLPNSTTTIAAANLLINSNSGTSPVTAIESAVSTNVTISLSNHLTNMDHTSPNQSNLIESNVDELNFDDNSLTNVTQCFNIKTEPEDDNLLNETGKCNLMCIFLIKI